MANSMTGFGRATVQADGRAITVELKSVNHRYLDIGMRLPRTLNFLEDSIRSVLGEKLERGHVDVFVNYRNTRKDSKAVELDEPLLLAYAAAAEKGARTLDALNDLSLSSLLRFPDVLTVTEAQEDQEAVCALCREAVVQAADDLIAMRAREGKKLADDLTERSKTLEAIRNRIDERAPLVVREYQAKLRARIAELLDGAAEVDESRLATEVAYFADKANITEELVRLESHIEQLRALLAQKEPTGKKLDFIVQEMNREMNTIGSKAADLTIADAVIAGKAEIEKIREQVQNIE